MHSNIIVLLLVFLAQGMYAQTTYSSVTKKEIEQVENNLFGRITLNGKTDAIHDRMAYYHVKGLSIAVIHNYKLIWAKGYGWANEKDKLPVTTATVFKPGSISKSLNAVGVLKLAQNKSLDLYQDINTYLTSWKFPYDSLSHGKKITVANLLSHTAGVSVYGGFPGYDSKSKIPTLPQVLDGIAPANTPAVRSLFEPGLKFQYSGGGTIITQLMITDLTKQSYENYMFDQVLKPLGMMHSFYSAAPPKKNELNKYAMGYTKDGNLVDATFRVYPEQAPLGLWTTPSDLANYVIETQLASKGKSIKVLNQSMARLQLTPYIDNSATLGAFIGDRNGEQYFFHDAGNEGYRGLYYGSVDDGNGVVVFVNSDDGNIILEVLNSVASVYNWKGFDKPKNINTVEVPEATLQKYVGVYLYDGKFAEVTKVKNEVVYWAGGQTCKMYFTSPNDFVNMEFPTEKSFLTDSLGQVIGFARRLEGKEFTAATKVLQVATIQANSGELNSFGWHLLESKRFVEAIAYLKRGIELEPNDFGAINNLAHGYLFNHDYEKAIQLYQDFLAKTPNDVTAQKNIIKDDFVYFRKIGLDSSLIARATNDLKL
jgi:CubicO group peptidase (beta-lactamase class C family)